MRTNKNRNKQKWVFFIFAIVFFLFSIFLFSIKDVIPKPNTTSNNILYPNIFENKIVSFKKQMKKSQIDFKSIEYATTSATLIVRLPSNTYVYINPSKDEKSQVSVLNELIKKNNIETPEKKIKYIDLRFEKVVVKYD